MADLKLDLEVPDIIKTAIDEKTGKIKDYISGKIVKATPEEVNAVQVFAVRLVEDFGYSKEQIQTHPQYRVSRNPSDESKSYSVDIAVFKNNKKIESNLLMIIECKNPHKIEGEKQLKTYLDLCDANIGVWFNGEQHTYFQKTQYDGKNEYKSLPSIPRNGQRIQDIGKIKRKELHITENLKTVFKDIRNRLSQSVVGITRDERLAEEIINLLFCKIYDEINTASNEIMEFRSGVDESENDVYTRIQSIFTKVKSEYLDIFNDSDVMNMDAKSVSYVVGELQNYCVKDAKRDVLGDAFEVFISPTLKGSQGQFFTPRNLVKLAVEIINPQEKESVIDPACGSGGFLVVALEHVWKKIRDDALKRKFDENWIKNKQQSVASKIIKGIDKDNFLAKVTKAHMAIIGDGRGGIFNENSLDLIENWDSKTKEKISFESANVIFTNPPFGSKIPISNKKLLEQFSLGYKWKKDKDKKWFKTEKIQTKQPPQILFIERCLNLLKLKGRMGIILPDGILGGSKLGYVPSFILENAKVIAIIDCPKTTFQPNTSTKTHLICLEKKDTSKKQSKKEDYDIFMAIGENVGHDNKGNSIYERDSEILNDDFIKIQEKFAKFKKGQLKKKDYDNLGYVVSSKWLENYLMAKRYLPKYIDGLKELRKMEKKGIVELKSINEIKMKPKGLFTGANIKAEEYVKNSNYRYIMTACITKYGVNSSNFKNITESSYNESKSQIIHEHDIIINRAGDTGTASIMTKDMMRTVACGFVFVLRLKKQFNPYYVTAFLNSRLGNLQTKRLSFGSILEHITKDDLGDVLIPIFKKESTTKKIIDDYKSASELQLKARKKITDCYKTFESLN